MSSFLHVLWDNTYGLLVDDGQLAIGAIVALAVTWTVAQVSETLRESVGWLLLAMVVVLVIANTYRAGHNARRKLKRD